VRPNACNSVNIGDDLQHAVLNHVKEKGNTRISNQALKQMHKLCQSLFIRQIRTVIIKTAKMKVVKPKTELIIHHWRWRRQGSVIQATNKKYTPYTFIKKHNRTIYLFTYDYLFILD
jgi:hypothetical protein